MPIWARIALFLVLVVVVAYVGRSRSPEVVAERLCARRYRAAQTAADTAALDPIRTVGRGGVIARYTCGELRLAGKLD